MRKKNKVILLLVLLLPMMGCTTPSQWKADTLVDELCAKDGGIKVYETVTLPKERFNQQGFFNVPFEGYDKPTDEYYRVAKTTFIKGNESSIFGALSIVQHHGMIYRRSDHKLLGESIRYSRRGGDPPLPAHPSSYSCPKMEEGLSQKIFLKPSN